MFEATLCEIVKDDKVLLKKACRGVSESKWNGLGGKIEAGETPLENVIREVKEESNLFVKNLRKHGILKFYDGSRQNLFFIVHLFSTCDCNGEIRECDEGELKWFDIDKIPYGDMWADDEIWMPLMLGGKEFDGDFVFDETRKKIIEHEIRIK